MDIQKKIKTFLLKIILKLPLITNLHKKNYYFKKKSPEMRFVFKITCILNLQKIQNKQKY